MILILITIIVVLIIAITHLCYDFYNQKKIFEDRIDVLEGIITSLHEKQSVQRIKLEALDALSEQLKDSKFILSKAIVDMNVDLFSVLFNKKS